MKKEKHNYMKPERFLRKEGRFRRRKIKSRDCFEKSIFGPGEKRVTNRKPTHPTNHTQENP